MKLTQQVYSATDTGSIKLTYDFGSRDQALNLTGYTWVDAKHLYVRDHLISKHQVIVTDTDLIAHDDYINQLSPDHLVVFICDRKPDRTSASRKRIMLAIAKLKSSGIRTKYFVNNDAMERYVTGLDQTKLKSRTQPSLKLVVNN